MNQYRSINSQFVNNLFKGKSIVIKLILINVALFVIIGLIEVAYTLFRLPIDEYHRIVTNNLSISAIPSVVLHKPWTLITYMFMHSGFFHILFNMLMLYWFGNIFRDFLKDHKLLDVYINGGLAGAFIYLLAYQSIPLLHNNFPALGMVGASASVVAILVATATYLPNYGVFMLFIGQIKLKYLAIFMVLVDILSLKEGNTGGHFAHLGGALFGFIYSYQLKRGYDIGRWVSLTLNFLVSAFKIKKQPKKVKFKVYSEPVYTKTYSKPTPEKTKSEQQEIDKILDKIAQSGYESLNDKEKDLLFKASKK